MAENQGLNQKKEKKTNLLNALFNLTDKSIL